MATASCINYQCFVHQVLILYVFKYLLSLFPHDLKMSRIGKRTSSCLYKIQCFLCTEFGEDSFVGDTWPAEKTYKIILTLEALLDNISYIISN